jgi:hypothetical protein
MPIKSKKVGNGVYNLLNDGEILFELRKSEIGIKGWTLTNEEGEGAFFHTQNAAKAYAQATVDGESANIVLVRNPNCPTMHCRRCGEQSKHPAYCTECHNRG